MSLQLLCVVQRASRDQPFHKLGGPDGRLRSPGPATSPPALEGVDSTLNSILGVQGSPHGYAWPWASPRPSGTSSLSVSA